MPDITPKRTHMRISWPLWILLALTPIALTAQENEKDDKRFSPKELTIPASPVFDMMGVTPSQINRTSDIRDFKVDWSFKSWRLNPNLAIQSQPIWELLYNKKNLKKYREASTFMRRLSSVDLSIGSVVNEENDRRLGFATKFNIYRQRDPLLQSDVYEGVDEKYHNEEKELEAQILDLKIKLDSTRDVIERSSIRDEIRSTEDRLLSVSTRRREEINKRAKLYVEENWNAGYLDVAFGNVRTYQVDSSGSLKSLRLNRNTGWSIWVNGGIGFGKRWFLTALVRNSWYEEQLDFRLRDRVTQAETSRMAVADNRLLSTGMNIRYGGSLYTFFLEFFYERKAMKTALEALNESFTTPAGFDIVPGTVKWNVVNPNNITFGGDWRISRNVSINYGMRCIFNKDWKFTALQPVVTLACMMR